MSENWKDGTERPEASFQACSLYHQAVDAWGDHAQSDMLVEEIGELLAALNQYRRGRIDLDALSEEVADVRIMLAQLETMTGMSSDDHVVEKLDRLVRRLGT